MAFWKGSMQCFKGTPMKKIHHAKLVLLGDTSGGKTCLVERYVNGKYMDLYAVSIGANFKFQTVELDDTTVRFQIWDIAGCERFRSSAPMYYGGAQAAIVVYDITMQDSFLTAKSWVEELQEKASPNIVIALAGNKADLAKRRMVEYEEAQVYAEENSLLFMEISAKTAMNVNEIFLAIAKKLPKTDPTQQRGKSSGGQSPVLKITKENSSDGSGRQFCSKS